MAHYYPAYPAAAAPAPASYFPPTWLDPPATWYAQSPTTPPRSLSPPHAEIPSPSPPTPVQRPTAVKVEPDDADGRFIMELSGTQSYMSMLSQSQAPPTEVPLRATQASPEMYDMMGVFRINPFSMHDGANRGKTPAHLIARPLEEEPVVFEWQVELAALETFSPEFDIGKNSPDPTAQEWDVDPDGSPEPDPQPQQQEPEPIHAPHPRTYAFAHPRATHPPTWTYPTAGTPSSYIYPPARGTLYTISSAMAAQ
ncbi:hypothetical protein BD779DRAFT_1469677 [Infundibulicybe gibba]|nr:hypothetical protein BD779DRAFT_1469677 [Infundibulicybe gibba]